VIRGETGCRSLPAFGRRTAGPVLCAAALAVAGCGGSSAPSTAGSTTNAAQTSTTDTFAFGTGNDAGTYVQQLLPVIRPWQKAALEFPTDFTRAVSAQDKAKVVDVVDTFRSANDTFASKLSKLAPPASAQGEQDDLVKRVKQLSSDLETAKTKIKSDTQALIQSAAALGQAVRSNG